MNLGGGNWTIEAAAATNQNGGPVTITVTVNDGTTTTNETFDVTVTAVNDAPVNSVPSAQFTDSNTPLILTGPNALSITDIDAGTSDLEITLAAINGTLTLNGTPSLSFTTGSGINDGVMVFRGRLSNINAALDGLTFDPTPGYNGTASISLKTDDLGNTGSGGSLSAKDVVSVTVGNATATFQQGVNSYTGTEDTELQNDNPSTSFGTATTISVDLQNGSLESQGLIQFANLFGSGPGQIPVGSVIDAASLTVTVFDEGNSAATISLHQMLTAWTEASTWNSATNGIQRNNVEAASVADSTMTLAEFTGPQTFDGLESTVQAWADGAANNGWVIVTDSTDGWDFYSSEDSTTSRRPVLTISYTAPIPAQIDLDANNSSGTTASGFAATFTEDGPAVLIADFDATLTDADDTQLQSMTVSLTNLLDVGAESLTANTAGTSITASYNPGAGVLTLTNADSLANYQQVLKTITYQNVSDTPNTTTRVITVVGNDGFANSNIATTSIAIVASNDAPSGLPTITGTVTEDQTLTADTSGISDADGLGVFSYQWLRNGSVIAGATSSTYTLGDADVGTLISVQVNYTDGDSTAEGPLTSAQTSAVANVNDVPTGTVTIDNMTPSQGDTLTAGNTLGDADGLSGPITYQWQRNGVDISGATAGSYTTTVPDVGTVITVVASYTDDQGTNESVSSAATAPVANTNDPPTGSVTISGTPTEDQILTASNTLADLDGLGPISYQWQRDTVDITGATSGTYTLADADVGATITVVARYTDGGGTPESVSSSGVGPIINVNDAPVGVPAITGTITEDQILTADTSGISDADGLGTFSYQWLRNGIAISGATGSTYTLGDADVGTLISVQIGYTDGQGTTEGPITSTQTPPIANVNDAPVGVPVITGTPTEDQILTADTGGISDADGLGAFSYQWLRNGSAIGGATGNAYTLSDADVGTFISVEVSYTDGHGTAEGPLTSAQTSAITNVNDEEVLTTNTGLTVNEGDVGSVISQTMLETTDIDNTSAQLVYTLTSAPTPATGTLRLSGTALINGSTLTQQDINLGLLTYDHNDVETFTDGFTFSVNDGSGSLTAGSFAITINPVNDNNPIITRDGGAASASLNVAENFTAVTTVTATDADLPVQTLRFAIVGGTDSARFSIGAASGNLSFATAPDFEAAIDSNGDNIYEVIVEVSDGLGHTDQQTILVTVTDIDEFNVTPIVDTDAAADAINENVATGTAVGITAFSEDLDGTTNTITYSLDDNAGGLFAIDSNTGVITTAATIDFESVGGSHMIIVRADSADGSETPQAYTITVNDLDEFDVTPIIDTDAAADNIDENIPVGSTVGITAFSEDFDATTNAITYSLDDNTGGLFAIDSTTGVVTTAASIDFESVGSSLDIVVRTDSADGSTTTQAYTITVTDLDEFDVTPIVDNNAAGNNINENVAVGTTVGITAFSEDLDGTTNTITYSLDDNAGGLFAIDSNTGVVTTAAAIDFEVAGGSVNVVVRATSSDNSTTTQSFTITVNDLNDNAPVVPPGQTFSVSEFATIATAVGTSVATDVDTLGSLSSWTIIAGTADGIFAIDAATGQITLVDTTKLNYEVTPSYSLTLTVDDGTATSAPQPVTISLINENDAPVFTPSAFTIDENSINGSTVGTILASDEDAGELLTYSIIGPVGHPFAVDANTGAITVVDRTELNFEATTGFSITVQVTDSGGLLDTQVVSIGVNDINESPTSISLTGGSVNENSTTGTTVGTASGTDVDAADTLSYSLINTASGRFQVDSVTGIITVADGTQLNFESASSHNITVRATDTGGLSYDESFTITISDVNEAPTAATDSFTGRQLKALIVPAGLVTANDFDIDGDSISVVVVNAPTSGTIQLNSDGSFSYTPKNSFSGLDSFTYYVTDGSLSSNLATVEIDVRIAVSGVDTDTESVLDSFVAGTTITDSETAAAETSAAGPDQNATGANATARINRTGDQTTGEEILDGQVAQETALQIMRRLSGQMAITIFLDEVPENELPDQSNRSSRSDESDQQERKNGSSNFLFERVVTENPFFLHISGNSTAKIDTTDRQEEVFPEMMFDKIVVGSTVAVSASMSVGYAIWLLSSRLYVFAHNNLRIILT